MPKEFGVKLLKANVVVAMVEVNAKSVKASSNKTFVFKISPPYSFCLSNNNLVGLNKKYVVQNPNKSHFLLYRIIYRIENPMLCSVKTHRRSSTKVFNSDKFSCQNVFLEFVVAFRLRKRNNMYQLSKSLAEFLLLNRLTEVKSLNSTTAVMQATPCSSLLL